jgi:Transposase DDE domain
LRLSRSRGHIEQYFQRSKDDLGWDPFAGRSWRGFHHHLALSAVAYLFILVVYLRAQKNFWADVGTGVASDPAVAGEIHRLRLLLPAINLTESPLIQLNIVILGDSWRIRSVEFECHNCQCTGKLKDDRRRASFAREGYGRISLTKPALWRSVTAECSCCLEFF